MRVTRKRLAAALDIWRGRLAKSSRRIYTRGLCDLAEHVRAGDETGAVERLIRAGPGGARARVEGFKIWMCDRGLSPSTVNTRLGAIKSLFRVLREFGLVVWPIDVRGVPVVPYRDTRGPDHEVMTALLRRLKASAQHDAWTARSYAMVLLMSVHGLRRGEVCGLDLGSVDLSGSVARIRVLGKGKTQRVSVTLSPKTREAITWWIRHRGREPGPLFTPLRGKPRRLSGMDVYRMVCRLGEENGARLRPHGLRHYAVTRALDLTGGNVREAQVFARHASPATTTLYDDARRDAPGALARLLDSHLP